MPVPGGPYIKQPFGGLTPTLLNNSGFVINTTLQNTGYKLNRYISLNKYIENYNFFKDYNNPKYNKTSYYCPSNRCGQLCNVASGVTSNNVKKIGLECNIHK